MEILQSDILKIAGVLIGVQIAAFSWRITREIEVSESGDIKWLPPADLMNLLSMAIAFLGVFILPIAGIGDERIQRLSLLTSMTLSLGYPFALAGHYELFKKGYRSYAYVTGQEFVAIIITIIIAISMIIYVT